MQHKEPDRTMIRTSVLSHQKPIHYTAFHSHKQHLASTHKRQTRPFLVTFESVSASACASVFLTSEKSSSWIKSKTENPMCSDYQQERWWTRMVKIGSTCQQMKTCYLKEAQVLVNIVRYIDNSALSCDNHQESIQRLRVKNDKIIIAIRMMVTLVTS